MKYEKRSNKIDLVEVEGMTNLLRKYIIFIPEYHVKGISARISVRLDIHLSWMQYVPDTLHAV